MESTDNNSTSAFSAENIGGEAVSMSGMSPSSEPKLYELTQRTLFSAHELRRLTADYEAIRRSCGLRLAVLFRAECELKLASLETPTFRQFVGDVSQPACLSLFKIEPLRGIGVIEMEPALALVLLDRLMGGIGAADIPARDLTEIEVALLGQVTHLITEAWCAHWSGWKELKSSPIGYENDGRYLQTSPAESAMLVARIEVNIGENTGYLKLALPFATIDPLIQKLRAEIKPPADLPATPSPVAKPITWNPALDHVNVPISADLPGPQVTARQIQKLKVGDVLHLPADATNLVQLRFAGVARFNARLGTRQDHWAVEVINALKS